MMRQLRAEEQEEQRRAEEVPSSIEETIAAGRTCGLLSDLYKFEIDLRGLIRRKRDFASIRKILTHGLGICILEPTGVIHGNNFVGSGRKAIELKTPFLLRGPNPAWARRIATD